jgi:hypothetical protein
MFAANDVPRVGRRRKSTCCSLTLLLAGGISAGRIRCKRALPKAQLPSVCTVDDVLRSCGGWRARIGYRTRVYPACLRFRPKYHRSCRMRGHQMKSARSSSLD